MKIAVVKRRYSLRHGGSERYCVNLSRRLMALGHDVTVIGVRIDDEKIRVVYNGVDTKVFHPGVRDQAEQVRRGLGVPLDVPLLVYASMDFKGKGLRSTFGALKRTKYREARLLVLGTGPIRQFTRIAREMGIGDRVIFGGHRGDIQQYYGAGDLFVLPSTYEPFPNVNLEAMACGLPVLTTATTGGAEVIVEGTNGYLIPHVNAVDEMVDWLDHHLSLSTTERAVMSEGCWSIAKRMTVEKNVQQTLDVFEEVLLEKFRV